VYEEVHKLVGCGSFVATLAKATIAGVDMAIIDLHRVADGRIVEHWDVMEEILPVDQWVNSGRARTDALTEPAWRWVGEDTTTALCNLVEPFHHRFVARMDETAGPRWMPALRVQARPRA